MTDFERKLQRQPIRELPGSWRREILAAAETTPAESTWGDWFWPAPAAWGALAAIWLLMAAVSALSPEQPALSGEWPGAVRLTSLAQHHVRVTGELPN